MNGRSLKEMGGKTYSSAPAQGPVILRDLGALPPPVWRMAKAIFEASQSDSLEALRMPIEMNEIATKPSAPQRSIRLTLLNNYAAFPRAVKTKRYSTRFFDTLTSGFVHVGPKTPLMKPLSGPILLTIRFHL